MAEARSNPDTALGTEFWQSHEHLFVPAGWGPEYCRCCLDKEREGGMHTQATDPATHVGNCTGYRVARREEVGYAVGAWNDDGSACSFPVKDSYEEAEAFARDLLENGDYDGRTYQHAQVEERRYYTAVDTNVAVIA